jgi:hypothetical protein
VKSLFFVDASLMINWFVDASLMINWFLWFYPSEDFLSFPKHPNSKKRERRIFLAKNDEERNVM